MLTAAHVLVVELDADERITMLKPNAASIDACVCYVFTERECVSA